MATLLFDDLWNNTRRHTERLNADLTRQTYAKTAGRYMRTRLLNVKANGVILIGQTNRDHSKFVRMVTTYANHHISTRPTLIWKVHPKARLLQKRKERNLFSNAPQNANLSGQRSTRSELYFSLLIPICRRFPLFSPLTDRDRGCG